jgi:hypothetical protein
VELFGGWEYERCFGSASFFLRAGAEWQHWLNFSSAFGGTNGNEESVFSGESNVGFAGFVLGAGVLY